jgi:hypothetical protein
MIINKVFAGWVVQQFDTCKGEWINQSFVCLNDPTFETEEGEPMNGDAIYEADLPLEMKQPEPIPDCSCQICGLPGGH